MTVRRPGTIRGSGAASAAKGNHNHRLGIADQICRVDVQVRQICEKSGITGAARSLGELTYSNR
jgi:hypothetical protein